MADDRHYVGGEWYRICDRTGFKVRDVVTQKEWNGRIVRNESWEPRQPQDLVQGVADDQTVVEPRPRSVNQFIGPLTTLTTANLAIGATNINIQSSLSMLNGDTVYIMMDNGVNMVTKIVSVNTTTSIQVSPAMTGTAKSGAQVTDVTAESIPILTQHMG